MWMKLRHESILLSAERNGVARPRVQPKDAPRLLNRQPAPAAIQNQLDKQRIVPKNDPPPTSGWAERQETGTVAQSHKLQTHDQWSEQRCQTAAQYLRHQWMAGRGMIGGLVKRRPGTTQQNRNFVLLGNGLRSGQCAQRRRLDEPTFVLRYDQRAHLDDGHRHTW